MTLVQTINLGNSIIGVSILAMPYCFRKCGVLLGIILIIASGVLNRFCCHLLLKSAHLTRRRTFELLAYHTFGSSGKLVVEVGILGFLIGTCVAFFVGDLGPSLMTELFNIPNGPHLRALIMTFLGMFVALPLALLRRVDSLTSFSALSLGLYSFLILKLFAESSSNMFNSDSKVFDKIVWWDSSAILSSIPILSMALACQTQIFEIFDSAHLISDGNNSLKKMNGSIRGAVNICSFVYIMVGLFGYFAFYDQPFRGNILLFLPPSFTSSMTKILFIITVVVSLPLCLFPCRTSLYSLLFRKATGSLINENATAPSIHMSDMHFRLLTICLIVITIGISVLLPHIEVVLGIIGSTIGSIICFILPAMIFINLTMKNTTERLLAHLVSFLGIFILIACSYSTVQDVRLLQDGKMLIESLRTMNPTDLKLPLKDIYYNPQKNGKLDAEAIKKEEKEIKIRPIQFDKIKSIKPPARQIPISYDSGKMKKQEELLQRLEKQQQEHQKLIEQGKELLKEIKKHEELHHKDGTPIVQPVLKEVRDHKENLKFNANVQNSILLEKKVAITQDKIKVNDSNKSKMISQPETRKEEQKPQVLNNISKKTPISPLEGQRQNVPIVAELVPEKFVKIINKSLDLTPINNKKPPSIDRET